LLFPVLHRSGEIVLFGNRQSKQPAALGGFFIAELIGAGAIANSPL